MYNRKKIKVYLILHQLDFKNLIWIFLNIILEFKFWNLIIFVKL